MLVDSHCHFHLIDLTDFKGDLATVLALARDHDVDHFLCVCVELNDFPQLEILAESFPNISISVGVHPNNIVHQPVDAKTLTRLSQSKSCIAIGETGLDYYRTADEEDKEKQRLGFREHIKAALTASKPLIIHTRDAADDTLLLMSEENAQDIGGVMHCFSESLDIAYQAIDLNFYISFSGIVTFKNAKLLQEVAKKIPLEKILIETDSPYLAPVPFRGKQNHPALVKYVAQTIAELRGVSFEVIANATTENFYRCFRLEQ
jgi:TatD DNase family protein